MTGSKGSPSGQVQAERLDLGQHAVQCRPVSRPVTAGAASAAGQPSFAAILEAYLAGTSTRKVDDLVRALGADTGSPSRR